MSGTSSRRPDLVQGLPAPDGLSPPEARELARQVSSAIGTGTVRDTAAAEAYLGNLQRDAAPAARVSQAQRDAARAASTAAPASTGLQAVQRAQAVQRPSRAVL